MRRIATPLPLVRSAFLAIVLVAVASCTTSTPAAIPADTPAASPAPTTSAASSAASPATAPPGLSSSAAADCDTGTWRAAPVSVTRHVAVPPMPVITAIRTAAHADCGYDRIVLDITGPAPGYRIKHVTRVTADPSGKTITLPGRSDLLITLRPAQAHTDSGSPAVTRRVVIPGHPMLKGYVLAGDSEGVLTLALGLRSMTSIRVGEFPGRLYIDLRA
jgi:hypothetical protein